MHTLVYLYDVDKAHKQGVNTTADILARYLPRIADARIFPFDSFVQSHRIFYLASAGDVLGVQEWQFHYLLKKGRAAFQWKGRVGEFDIYRVQMPNQ